MQTTNKLCKGYMTNRFDEAADALLETLYAVLDDGSILVSKPAPFSIKFERDTWEKTDMTIDQLHAIGAEFIGNYDAPRA